jgi:hypothetical protein
MSFGFIITRHVNSETTNEYWNHCVKLIRSNYPHRKIIVIDDNSNYGFVKAHFNYKNIEIIQSEYPGRGELLPYVYYIRHKWFENAVIIHDSVFFHKRIPFETFKMPVLPFWHWQYDKEHLSNLLRLSSFLKNNLFLKKKLTGSELNILGLTQKENFNLVFGGICYINHSFLMNIESKYALTNLVNVIKCRMDRCGLERILGLLFFAEYPQVVLLNSLFGTIHNHYKAFAYNYGEYINDFNNKKLIGSVVKVWTGR